MAEMELWAAENEPGRGAAQDTHLCLQPACRTAPPGAEKEMALLFAMRAALGLVLQQNLGCDTVRSCHNLDMIQIKLVFVYFLTGFGFFVWFLFCIGTKDGPGCG